MGLSEDWEEYKAPPATARRGGAENSFLWELPTNSWVPLGKVVLCAGQGDYTDAIRGILIVL